MYRSGLWRGFWQQEQFGKQSMHDFTLKFAHGTITGQGTDIVGEFLVAGEYHTATGQLTLTKQYHGKHAVEYIGHPDGEGSIQGTWTILAGGFRTEYTGPFLMQPANQGQHADDAEIVDITR